MITRKAFTLVELLVVVGIIGLLVSLLLPSLSAGRDLARSAKCKHNLHQIGIAFHGAGGDGGLTDAPKLFPMPNAWPTIPMNVLPQKEIFQCPEEKSVYYSVNEYYMHTNYGGGIDIPFAEDRQTALCRLIEEDATSMLFGFDDGNARDLWTGTIDIYIRVLKTVPQVGINETEHYQGWEGAVPGVLSLYRGGQVVPGWEDFRHVPKGASFTMASGNSSYGYNAKAHAADLPTETVVVLDYPNRVANTASDSLDLSANLVKASKRHRGRLNILFADGSVATMGPTQIDPGLNDRNARRWTPAP